MPRRIILTLVAAAVAGLANSTLRAAPDGGALMDAACRRTGAVVQPLATVRNTYDRDYQCLGVRVDAAANVTAIRFETHRPDGHGTNRDFTLAEVASDRGAVLDGRPGHDAVILRGRIAAHAGSAALTVAFLRNGMTGEYRDCHVTLARDPAKAWHLLDAAGQRTSAIVVQTWGLPLVGTLGIDTLRGICPEAPKT